eukprot:6209022-Prymnesium_polylepis.1
MLLVARRPRELVEREVASVAELEIVWGQQRRLLVDRKVHAGDIGHQVAAVIVLLPVGQLDDTHARLAILRARRHIRVLVLSHRAVEDALAIGRRSGIRCDWWLS